MIRVLSGNTYLLHKSATFAQFVANTVSHEIGHTFGLLDAYLSTGGIVTDTSPYDIMQSGSNADGDLTFSSRNQNLLRAALGIHANGDRANDTRT